MKKTFSNDLFERYANGTCTDEEKVIVEGWYLNALKQNDSRPSELQLQIAKEEIRGSIKPVSKVIHLIKWGSVAAAIFVAFLFVYLFQKNDPSGSALSNNVASVNQPENLPEEKADVFAASKDENKMIKLSDGTIVILHKGSSLTLLPDFNKQDHREVELQGKAFFDVAHNAERPFVIYTGAVKTTVLGTAFDITALPGSKSVKVNVIRGRVEVKNTKSQWVTVLSKNYQVIFDDKFEKPLRNSIDASKELAWNNQEGIVFTDVSFRDAKKLLEDRFGVKINLYGAELQELEFSTSLRATESLDHFLSILCNAYSAKHIFSKDSTEVTIKPLNQN